MLMTLSYLFDYSLIVQSGFQLPGEILHNVIYFLEHFNIVTFLIRVI